MVVMQPQNRRFFFHVRQLPLQEESTRRDAWNTVDSHRLFGLFGRASSASPGSFPLLI